MRRRRIHALLVLSTALLAGPIIVNGCAAGGSANFLTTGAGGAGGASSAEGGNAMTASAYGGGDIVISDAGADSSDDVTMNPCGSKCGPEELCDPDHLGLDDNCDGLVDEGCPCSAGAIHFCFKGDPSYRNAPGCFDGTERCTENGSYGDCKGGVHAFPPQNCFANDTSSCHPIHATPFADILLRTGTGTFRDNATPNSEVWTVECPDGVSPCPTVTGTTLKDQYKPLQSGQYKVTYTKLVQGGGTEPCTYPLFVGAPGLRVELTWEHHAADTGVDLDLHVHQPNSVLAWGPTNGVPQDCSFLNCVVSKFAPVLFGTAPKWFAEPPATPPTPVNWWLDTAVPTNNTCYFAPQGVGEVWKANKLGCHSPRLDLDNVECDLNVTDPNQPKFCAPENINIDFPPSDQWIRVAVNYFSNRKQTYPVHPSVKIFCDGGLAAELGATGYSSPSAPVTFSAADGAAGAPHRFWMVADVAFKHDTCSKSCVVKPLYADKDQKTPFFTTDTDAQTNFGPAYPSP